MADEIAVGLSEEERRRNLFRDRLVERRTALGLTQADLANAAGVGEHNVASWERNVEPRVPGSLSAWRRLADALMVPVDYLIPRLPDEEDVSAFFQKRLTELVKLLGNLAEQNAEKLLDKQREIELVNVYARMAKNPRKYVTLPVYSYPDLKQVGFVGLYVPVRADPFAYKQEKTFIYTKRPIEGSGALPMLVDRHGTLQVVAPEEVDRDDVPVGPCLAVLEEFADLG